MITWQKVALASESSCNDLPILNNVWFHQRFSIHFVYKVREKFLIISWFIALTGTIIVNTKWSFAYFSLSVNELWKCDCNYIKHFICIQAFLAVFAVAEAKDCPRFCPFIYDPICVKFSSLGVPKFFANRCLAKQYSCFNHEGKLSSQFLQV